VLLRWFACEVGGIGKGIGAAMELLGNNRSAACTPPGGAIQMVLITQSHELKNIGVAC